MIRHFQAEECEAGAIFSSQPGGKGGPRAKPVARKAQPRQVWAARRPILRQSRGSQRRAREGDPSGSDHSDFPANGKIKCYFITALTIAMFSG